MATKKLTERVNLIDTFKDFKETKNIDRTTLVSVIEDSFRSVLQKTYGSDENFDVIVNPDKGDFEIYRNRVVVEDGEVQNENAEISLSEAQQIDKDFEVGEEVSEKVEFAKFGRRAILTLRQTMASKILDLEHDNLYNKYVDKVGQIVSGEVYQIWKREMLLLDDEGNELLLPKGEQIPGDFFRKGETARAVVLRVDNLNNNLRLSFPAQLRSSCAACWNKKCLKSTTGSSPYNALLAFLVNVQRLQWKATTNALTLWVPVWV